MLEKAQIPEILPVAVLPKITESNLKWTFRNAMNDKLAAAKMAEFAYNTLTRLRLRPTRCIGLSVALA